jgi:hypothetical protein
MGVEVNVRVGTGLGVNVVVVVLVVVCETVGIMVIDGVGVGDNAKVDRRVSIGVITLETGAVHPVDPINTIIK